MIITKQNYRYAIIIRIIVETILKPQGINQFYLVLYTGTEKGMIAFEVIDYGLVKVHSAPGGTKKVQFFKRS